MDFWRGRAVGDFHSVARAASDQGPIRGSALSRSVSLASVSSAVCAAPRSGRCSKLDLDMASSTFLRERERLVAEIAEGLGRLGSNLNALNRNIEAVGQVGEQFAPVADLWVQVRPSGLCT